MGMWSCSLYGNDITLDVKETYVASLKNTNSDEEALMLTLKTYKDYMATEEECMVWFALADTQWKTGRLCEKVKERAIHFLQQSGGAELFSGNDKKKWLKTLEMLEQQLDKPMKPYKRMKKENDEKLKLWNVGDVYAYRFSTKCATTNGLYGKYILMQKVDEIDGYQQKRFSVIHIFDKLFDELPDSNEIKYIRLLPIDSAFCENGKSREFPLVMSCVMEYIKASEYPSNRLRYIGNEDVTINTKLYNNRSNYSWYRMEENWLCDFYIQWQGKEYIEDNGEYYPKDTD